MSPKLTFTAAIVAAALCLAVVPADAQSRGDRGRQSGGERAVQGASAPQPDRARQAVPRASAPRQPQQSQAPQPLSRGNQERQPQAPQQNRQQPAPQMVPRGEQNRQLGTPQTMSRTNEGQQYQAPQTMTRGGQVQQQRAPQMAPQGAPRASDNRQATTRQAVPRGSVYGPAGQRPVPPAGDRYQSPAYRPDNRGGYVLPPGGRGPNYPRTYVRPRYFEPYRPLHFVRPYYSFRAHLNLGFGLWLGVAVPYPWSFFGDYRPRLYGYYPDGYYSAAPVVQYYGGLSFDIQPSDADLYVDGEYVGTVGTFTPYGEPLTLLPGVHRIAIVREGFQTMEWDVNVVPGEVIPYRGMMVPW